MLQKLLITFSVSSFLAIRGTFEHISIGWLFASVGTTASLVFYAATKWQRVEDKIEILEKAIDKFGIIEKDLALLSSICKHNHLEKVKE